MPTIYRQYGIQVETEDITPLDTIAGIESYSLPTNIEVNQEGTDGSIFPTIVQRTGMAEQMTFQSKNVDDCIDIIGVNAQCLKGGVGLAGFKFFLQALDKCNPGVSTNGIEFQVPLKGTGSANSSGLLIPAQIACNHQADMTYDFRVEIEGNAGNSGITATEDVVLPTINDNKNRFTLAPEWNIDSVEYDGKKSIQIDFGINSMVESWDSGLFPEWISIDQAFAKITVRGVSPEWIAAANIPIGGKSFTHANMDGYFRKRDPDSATGFVANGTAEHIKCTAFGKAYATDRASGSGRSPAESAFIMYLEYDSGGAQVPLVMNTGQAIP